MTLPEMLRACGDSISNEAAQRIEALEDCLRAIMENCGCIEDTEECSNCRRAEEALNHAN